MPGTYRGRSRHRLPRREGARIAGRTGGVPQYVPADGVHTWHRIPAKVFQVSLPAVHLPRNPCESVPGVPSRCPPGTEFPRKCSRCPFLPSTCHGIPAKAFQVSLPASHLPRNPCKSVPGVLSCRPPATVFPRKCSRCLFPPSTCHGFPAKVCQVSPSAVHLARKSRESVPGVLSCRPPATEFPRKCVRWHLPASYLPRQFISSRDVGVFQ